MTTDFEALDLLHPLPPGELFRQWVLTRAPEIIPAEWQKCTLSGWHLGAHPTAHVCGLRADGGSRIGWVINPHVHLSGDKDVVPTDELTFSAGALSHPDEMERVLFGRDEQGRGSGDGLEGPWVAVVLGNTRQESFRRLYVGATHSAVYSPGQRIAATTHNLIPGLRRDEALSRAFDPLATKSWFTFGLTAFSGLRRLLPNHYLDLDTFMPVRHWPRGSLAPLADGARGAAAIVDHARRLIAPLCERYSCRIPLSAGRDSRAVLAVVRPFIRAETDIELVTAVGTDIESRTDLQTARRLARITGLPHAINRRRRHDPNSADVMRAFARIGESRGGKVLSAAGDTSHMLDHSHLNLAGMGGETGRAFLWASSPPVREATPEDLARRMRSPVTEAVIDAASAWLDGLPAEIRASAADTLDLAYVEQRLGCWQAPLTYQFANVVNPMATAFSIETMLRLPEAYRAAGVLQHDMVAAWPELLEVPFNTPAGVLRVSRDIARAARVARYRFRVVRRRLISP